MLRFHYKNVDCSSLKDRTAELNQQLRCIFSGFVLESTHMELTGGMQKKNIALEPGIKRKKMGCFLFRNKLFWFLFAFGFFLIDFAVQSGRQKINGSIK